MEAMQGIFVSQWKEDFFPPLNPVNNQVLFLNMNVNINQNCVCRVWVGIFYEEVLRVSKKEWP